MKKQKSCISYLSLFCLAAIFSGCSLAGLDLQENNEYNPHILNPNINRTAKQYLIDRGGVNPQDTVFKWMKMGLEYAEIDLAEYEKPGRTFIFLHNEAIRRVNSSGTVTGGMFFDFPIVEHNAGQPVLVNGALKTTPAKKWSDYSKETVRNYFLYLIVEGEFPHAALSAENRPVQTLLPPNTKAGTESRLGYIVAPSSGISGSTTFTTDPGEGNGFDPDGKMNLRLDNRDASPLIVNDKGTARTMNIIATNGVIHVYGTTFYPFR